MNLLSLAVVPIVLIVAFVLISGDREDPARI